MNGARVRSALVLILSTGVFGLAGIPQRPAAPAAPSAAFARLFDQYRHGSAGPAIGAFAKWSAERVAAEAMRPADVTDTTTLEALALFHTDAGIASGRFGLFSESSPSSFVLGSWGLEDVFEIHSYTAYKIVDSLVVRGKAEHDATLLRFARSWYVVAISACAGVETPTTVDVSAGGVPSFAPMPDLGRGGRGGTGRAAGPDAPPDNSTFRTAANGKAYCVEGLADKARHDFSDNGDVMLTLGAMREPIEMTRSQVEARHLPFNLEYGQKAINDFNDALKLDPGLSEARLRKAHILHIARNEPDATPMLEQVLTEARAARDKFVWHLSALFLGEIHEDHGDLAAAIPYYGEAVSVIRTHTASIALGQALIRSGRTEEGWAVGARMFGREGQGADPEPDPWLQYRRVGYWQLDDRLAALRDMVRGQ